MDKKREIKAGKDLNYLFTTWEIAQFPKAFNMAITKAGQREAVRNQLRKLQTKRTNSADHKGSAGSRQKYSRVLGQIGYEQLPLLSMSELPEIEVYHNRCFLCAR